MFEWDDANEEHIARHGVGADECEEALADPDLRRARAPDVYGELRWRVLGSTETGRLLFLVYTVRSDRFRVVTARNADSGERRLYERSAKGK